MPDRKLREAAEQYTKVRRQEAEVRRDRWEAFVELHAAGEGADLEEEAGVENLMLGRMTIDGYLSEPDELVCDLTGTDVEEVRGEFWLNYAHEADHPIAHRSHLACLALGESNHLIRLVAGEGCYRWFFVELALERDDDGAAAAILLRMVDVHERLSGGITPECGPWPTISEGPVPS